MINRTLLALLLLTSSALAQDYRRVVAHVTHAYPTLAAYDFGLSTQDESSSNTLEYRAKDITLAYTGEGGCLLECTFTGTWASFSSTEVGDCILYSGTATGTFSTGYQNYTGVNAVYAQVFCADGPLYWEATGDFTVTFVNQEMK